MYNSARSDSKTEISVKEYCYTPRQMMYLHDEDRVNLHNQIASFIERATKQ